MIPVRWPPARGYGEPTCQGAALRVVGRHEGPARSGWAAKWSGAGRWPWGVPKRYLVDAGPYLALRGPPSDTISHAAYEREKYFISIAHGCFQFVYKVSCDAFADDFCCESDRHLLDEQIASI